MTPAPAEAEGNIRNAAEDKVARAKVWPSGRCISSYQLLPVTLTSKKPKNRVYYNHK
jgi:hypothetical protein